MSDNHHGLYSRAAHTGVYIHNTDSLYVWGGFNLNHVLSDMQVSFLKSVLKLQFKLFNNFFRFIDLKAVTGKMKVENNCKVLTT